MGNRATLEVQGSGVEIYLHWNGGRESVQAFCNACKELGFRSPAIDKHYATAYLIAVCGVFFGNGLSLGAGKLKTFGSEDNGHYIIGGNWEILSGGGVFDTAFTEGMTKNIIDKWTAARSVG
jgi:hypothetical protein